MSAQVDQAQAQVDFATSQLDATTVVTPTDGVVAQRGVEVGEMVGTSTLAFVIIDVGSVLAEAGVSEEIVSHISVGDAVNVTVDAVNVSALQGSVESVSPATDERGLYTVKVKVGNPGGAIKPGMLARLRFLVRRAPAAPAVPNSAVVTENGADYLYIVKENVVHKTQVQVGASDAHDTQITTGLSLGDVVVVEGQSFLADGDPVTPMP